MNVLVTGSTSLLGRAVARRLIDRGDQVAVLQRGQSGLGVPEHRIDLGRTAPAELAPALAGQTAIVHLAAKVGVVGSWQDYEQANVVGTETLVRAAASADIARFVHISSPSVAHAGTSLIGAQAAPADPARTHGHYATTKAMAERFVLDASPSIAGAAMSRIALRPHLVWGPGDTQLVGRIIERAQQGRLATIGSGAALIDSLYIDNAADAIVAGVDRCPELSGQAFVVSNNQPRPVRELIERIVLAAGEAPPRLRVPRSVAKAGGAIAERVWDRTQRNDDPPMTRFLAEQLSTAHWFDQRQTQAALQWKPTVSLDEGFARLAEWFRESPYVDRVQRPR